MTFYLGKPTLGLVALSPPLRGLTPTLERPSTVHESSAGGRVVDLAPRTRRTFGMAWMCIDQVTYSTLEEFYTGARGPGPFILLDPGRRNHLTANQSGTTSVTNDATGFAVADGAGEGLSSASVPLLRGPRTLRWSLPGTVVSGVLDLTPPIGALGFPVPAATPWTWSGQITCTGLAPSVTVTPALQWIGLDGAQLALTLGTPVVAAAGWLPWSVSLGAVPAGALFVRPQLRVAPGVLFSGAGGTDAVDILWPRRAAAPAWGAVAGPNRPGIVPAPPRPSPPSGAMVIERAPSSGTDIVLDQLQLDMSATARPWVVGTGMPWVSLTSLQETYTLLPERNVTATLIEVG